RHYTPGALREAAALYEGAKVNVNHPKGHPAAPRDYQDRLGTVRQVVYRDGAGLFAELHFNPKHALAEQLIWDAEQAPHNVGFSHNVEAVVKRLDDGLLVERITRVNSVDLVADPATTRGLFENQQDTGLLAALREENEHLRRELAASARRHEVSELLVEFRLPPLDCKQPHEQAITSPLFVEQLLDADSPQHRRRLVEERAALCRTLREQVSTATTVPQSRGPQPTTTPPDAKSFARSIT
ncbi:MAG: hypothetical protein WD030_09465, partial [Pirellulales bacterium]